MAVSKPLIGGIVMEKWVAGIIKPTKYINYKQYKNSDVCLGLFIWILIWIIFIYQQRTSMWWNYKSKQKKNHSEHKTLEVC